MEDRELLREIYNKNKAIDRNIQRVLNVGLIWLFGKTGHEAKEKNDKLGKWLSKIGLVLIALSEILLIVADVVDYRKSNLESEK